MSYIELFLLAAGLCFDTFAVSLTEIYPIFPPLQIKLKIVATYFIV